MPQLKEALRAAGMADADERLRDIAVHALLNNASSYDGAADAVFSEVRKDLALVKDVWRAWREATP